MVAERQVTIQNMLGLHVRPSAEFAGTAAKFKSRVSVLKDGQTVIAEVSRLVGPFAPGESVFVWWRGEDELRFP